jgi:hypothetical protein
MNWKNVAFLVDVERKSGRLIRGQRLTHYRENKFTANIFYIVALVIGVVIGLLVGNTYSGFSADVTLKSLVLSVFMSLPTLF